MNESRSKIIIIIIVIIIQGRSERRILKNTRKTHIKLTPNKWRNKNCWKMFVLFSWFCKQTKKKEAKYDSNNKYYIYRWIDFHFIYLFVSYNNVLLFEWYERRLKMLLNIICVHWVIESKRTVFLNNKNGRLLRIASYFRGFQWFDGPWSLSVNDDMWKSHRTVQKESTTRWRKKRIVIIFHNKILLKLQIM